MNEFRERDMHTRNNCIYAIVQKNWTDSIYVYAYLFEQLNVSFFSSLQKPYSNPSF